MTREEWARSLPNPIHPAQVVERLQAALDATTAESTAILTAHDVIAHPMPTKVADAQRDAIKLIDGAKQYAQHAPDTAWTLDSDVGKKGLNVGLALFDTLDDLRRVAMGWPNAEGIADPIAAAQRVARGAERMASAAKQVGQAIPTIAIIAGLLWLAHHFHDGD